MITEDRLVEWAERAAREARPFTTWWVSSVCQSQVLLGRFLNPETHQRCLDAYNRISPPSPRART